MQDYGAIDTPAATAPKRIGRKTVIALVATLGLAAGVAALSLTLSKKTADVASLYDPTEPHPLYCPWEPNSIVCVLGCGALCQLGLDPCRLDTIALQGGVHGSRQRGMCHTNSARCMRCSTGYRHELVSRP